MKRDYLLEHQRAAAPRPPARLLPTIAFLLLAINAAISVYQSRLLASALLTKLLAALGFLFLIANVAAAACHAIHHPATLAFILFSYVDLVLLSVCLSLFERLGPGGSPGARRRLRAAIWSLATALNLAFAWRVTVLMPRPLAVVIWAMSVAVAAAGFYGLFLLKQQEQGLPCSAVDGSTGEEKLKIYHVE